MVRGARHALVRRQPPDPVTTTRAARTSLAACATVLAVAAAAQAQPSSPAPATASATAPTLDVPPGVLLRRVTVLRGTVRPGAAGRTVEIQRRDARRRWVRAATGAAAADGTVAARWRPGALGRVVLRLAVRRAGGRARAVPAAPGASATTTVFRPALATWYGPRFFGRRTACGVLLDRLLLGVAHRTLPCGTPVTVFHAGRSTTVPVVDRGPFAGGASFDLTQAAAEALGMTTTATVGVLAHRGATMAPPPAAPTPEAQVGGVGVPMAPPWTG